MTMSILSGNKLSLCSSIMNSLTKVIPHQFVPTPNDSPFLTRICTPTAFMSTNSSNST